MLVFLNTRDGKVLSFAVGLVGEIGGKDVCVTRYDTAHGLAHRDVLGLRSGLIEKEWLFHLTTDQAFNYAYQVSENIMKRTSSTSKRTRKPTIVRVPAHDGEKVFTVEEAESILKQEGFRPLSKGDSIRFRKFLRPDY